MTSTNRHAVLNNEKDVTKGKNHIESKTYQTENNLNVEMDQIIIKSPPPIFVCMSLDFVVFCIKLID